MKCTLCESPIITQRYYACSNKALLCFPECYMAWRHAGVDIDIEELSKMPGQAVNVCGECQPVLGGWVESQ